MPILPKEIHTVQSCLLEMMRVVVDVCERHNIHYYLVEGTLLGAVRHQGFIPWDDDVDIAISVDDMGVFIDYCLEELPENLYVRPYFSELRAPAKNTEPTLYSAFLREDGKGPLTAVQYVPDLTRICNKTFSIIDQSGKHMDLYVDIPVLIGLPKGKLLRMIYYYVLNLKKLLVRVSKPELIQTNYWSNNTLLRRAVIWLVNKFDFSRLFPYKEQLTNLVKLLHKYSFNNSQYVLLYPTAYKTKGIVPREWYGKGLKAKFENLAVQIPEKHHKILTVVYGDYRQLPPEVKRTPSHVWRIVDGHDNVGKL